MRWGHNVGDTYYTYMDSPVGRLLIAGHSDGLRRISFTRGKGAVKPGSSWILAQEPLREAAHQLAAYFAGSLRTFNLPLAPGGTPFQRSVWQKMREIPYGATASYQAIARAVGKPKAVRAVGSACARNPLPIVIPCHRVIGTGGSLGGYGGGLSMKKALLSLEQENSRA